MPNRNRSRRSAGQGVVVVGIDSHHDPSTKAIWQHRQKRVYDYLRQRLDVVLLDGEKATRRKVMEEAMGGNVKYLTGAGHGDTMTFTGHDGQRIFHVDEYDPKVPSEKIVHFLSCLTAKKLGPDFVSNGCSAYFGYDVDLKWPDTCDAKILVDCDSEIDRALADGLTAGKAYKRAVKEFTRQANELEQRGGCLAPAYLRKYRDHLCAPSKNRIWGKKRARLPLPAR